MFSVEDYLTKPKQCLRAREILSNSRIPEPFRIPF
ncbi:hypothetical protein T11_12119 [Trichinella zimbabwensis]|uniref:Uncharacterized protein n=1 Tax=Trichinella zimbabwensis TaxID=268475 RepID=A0A0V1GE11_9BILA|nr:hypothetical protein T11_12119 [Trichinella zimbabwensis]